MGKKSLHGRRWVAGAFAGLSLAFATSAPHSATGGGAFPHQPKRLHADAARLAGGTIRQLVPWKTMRIYYARTPAMTLLWSGYVDGAARELISELDFSRYGVLAVFTPTLGCLTTTDVDPVYLGPGANALTAVVTVTTGDGCLTVTAASYALVKVRKSSLPYRVGRLYIKSG
jgi:hypothetical protein